MHHCLESAPFLAHEPSRTSPLSPLRLQHPTTPLHHLFCHLCSGAGVSPSRQLVTMHILQIHNTLLSHEQWPSQTERITYIYIERERVME